MLQDDAYSFTGSKRVAVIGSGLAGLTTAYLLRREGVEVWLIEKSDRIGFHSASVEIPLDHASTSTSKSGPGHRSRRGSMKGEAGSVRQGKWVIDVPMRSFQGGYYPLLIALYRHLGIPLKTTHFTFSFSHLLGLTSSQPKLEPHFVYSGASGLSLPTLPRRAYRSPKALVNALARFLGLALAYVLWLVIAFLGWHNLLPLARGRQTTLRDFTSTIFYRLTYPLALLSKTHMNRLRTPLGNVFSAFITEIILPLFSAVGTMTTSDVLDTPIGCLLDYVYSTFGTSHYSLGQGYTAANVAEKLVEEVKEQGEGYLRLGEEVQGMEYMDGGGIRVKCRGGDVEVDQIVLATQASAARVLLGMLESSLAAKGPAGELGRVRGMRRALGQVEYRETIVVTHRDHSVLPSPADTREINLVTPLLPPPSVLHHANESSDEVTQWDTPPLSACSTASSAFSSSLPTPQPATPCFRPSPDRVYTMGTHVVQPPLSLRARGVEAVLQSTNPVCPIDPDTVIAIAKMERALPLRDPALFVQLHPGPSQSTPLVHLAGSYAYPGIPLLEGCVGSAIHAVQAILGEEWMGSVEGEGVGGVDWDSGRGGWMGRVWRWRRGGKGL